MRFFVISGSWPPETCGVGDFSGHLVKSLREAGHEAVQVRLSRFNVFTAVYCVLRSWFSRGQTLLMYPTEGYGYSVLPFLFAFGHPFRVHLYCHEYASKNRVCRRLLRLFASKPLIFFGNSFDMEAFLHEAPLGARRHLRRVVTGIPSNIPRIAVEGVRDPGPPVFCHFGQIRPGKGLEEMQKVFARMKALRPHWRTRLIGGYPGKHIGYAEGVLETFRKGGTEVILNGTPEVVSRYLGGSDAFVAWFPEGPCERRGSLMAALGHQLICYTNQGARTPLSFHNMMILFPEGRPLDADEFTKWLIDRHESLASGERDGLLANAKAFTQKVTFAGLVQIIEHETK